MHRSALPPQLILLSISIEEQCKCLRKNFNEAVAQLMKFIDRSDSLFCPKIANQNRNSVFSSIPVLWFFLHFPSFLK